jgi:uncharacterized membrane protein
MPSNESRGPVQVLRAEFSGPLPPPKAMADYENVVSGSAERILAMAEAQAAHRREMEKTVIKGNIRSQFWGLGAAFVIVIIGIGAGTFLIYSGKNGYGLAVILAELSAMVAVFIWGKQSQQQERNKKMDMLKGEGSK